MVRLQKVDAILERMREESFLKDVPEEVLTDIEAKVNRRSDEIDEKIRFVTDSHLIPAIKRLMHWMDGKLSAPMRLEIGETVQALSEVIDTLKPVVEIQEGNLRKLARKVVLITEDKKLEVLCKLSLGGTGVQFQVMPKNAPIPDIEPQIILLDQSCSDQYQMLAQRFPECEIVLVVGNDIPELVTMMGNLRDVKYFATFDKSNRAFSIRSIATTVKKILQNDYFGMEKYLMWETHIESRRLTCSDDRLKIIEEMRAISKGNGVRSTILDRAHTVSEELLMNSIYAAPKGSDGTALYNHLGRDVKIDLSLEQQPDFRFATDGTVLAISVSDPFGSLSKDIIQLYLTSCYEGKAGRHNDQKGGAGRGLHMIVETADFTVFNIRPSVRTEIICFFNLENSESENRSTINLFQI